MAIQANELRIGNIIYLCGSLHDREIRFDGVDREFELTGFLFGKLLYYKHGKNFNVIFEVKPIPLTEEWLLKFGFENKKIRIGVYDLIVVLPNSAFYNGCGFPCKYVHQLQNLYFAITGEELTMKT